MQASEPCDIEFIATLPGLSGGLPPDGGDTLTRRAYTYVVIFLQASGAPLRSDFERPFQEVVEDVAARVVDDLLRAPDDGAAGGRRQVEILLGRMIDIPAAPRGELLHAYHRLLRTQAEDALVAEWRREHSREARLLKLFRRVPKGSPNPRIVKGSHGFLVISGDSRPGLPQVPARELEGLFADPSLPVAARFAALPSVLQPRDGHGGWCVLLDLLHASTRIDPRVGDRDSRPSGVVCRIIPIPSRGGVAGEANSL